MIGVDGGGTKTVAVAYDLEGNVLGEGRSGFSNVMVDFKEATKHILAAIYQAQENLRKENCKYIYLGIAGSEGIENKDELIQIITNEFQTKISVVNDSIIAHAAMLQGKDGILAISGTGAIAVGIRGDKSVFTGGWGHLLGDEGSGYWIVMEAFRQMILETDESLPLCQLSSTLLEEMGYTDPQDIKLFAYSRPKAEVAKLSKVVTRLADTGDAIACRILYDAGQKLGSMTWNCYKKLGCDDQIIIALSGSIFEHIPQVMDSYKQYLSSKIQVPITWMLDVVPATKGAYYLATKEL
ncbi:ATPase [Shimazuella sp. AN120528]|uniref:N-acetylglucosamine kinase n=1 Tax=Shimazuella soli TaxID=1892854 RepID=UPI001F0FE1F8|nr:ATPase [Shimazuella soli]